jgi:hypothetical protein
LAKKNIDLLPLQNSLSKFINVPAALLINNKKKDDMGNSILEKIKSLLNNMDDKADIENIMHEEKEEEKEVPKNDEVGDAIQMLKDNGYFVLSPEEMESMHSKQKEEIESMYKKSDEQKNSIDEIESVLETLSTELVALRNQVKKGVGLPSGGTTAEKIIETKAKLSPFDSFAGLVKNKISQR